MQKTSIKVGHRNNPKELEAIFFLALVGGARVMELSKGISHC